MKVDRFIPSANGALSVIKRLPLDIILTRAGATSGRDGAGESGAAIGAPHVSYIIENSETGSGSERSERVCIS